MKNCIEALFIHALWLDCLTQTIVADVGMFGDTLPKNTIAVDLGNVGHFYIDSRDNLVFFTMHKNGRMAQTVAMTADEVHELIDALMTINRQRMGENDG